MNVELPRNDLYLGFRAGVEVRETSEGPPTLFGHFTKFNEPTVIDSWEGRFVEEIAPGAFTESFERMVPKVTLNHGHDPQLGDQVLGVPSVMREDVQGPYYEVPLFDGVPTLVMSGLRAGAYGASFRFHVDEEEVDRDPGESEANPEGLPARTITKASVSEFGPVTFPAYEGATAQLRSLTDVFRPVDFDQELAQMAREHPTDLAVMIERALKPAPAPKAPEPTEPAPSRFRTREDFLTWMSTS
jgi:hypothetical protein